MIQLTPEGYQRNLLESLERIRRQQVADEIRKQRLRRHKAQLQRETRWRALH